MPNLFPGVFSFEVDNLQGELGSYYLDSYNGTLEFTIHNQGWHSQEFSYAIEGSQGSLLLENNVFIERNSSHLVEQSFDLAGNGLFSLTVVLSDNSSSTQSIQFSANSTSGDINGDGNVDILDVILVVNIVLANEYNGIADFNLDSTVDILDLVQLVNMILYRTY